MALAGVGFRGTGLFLYAAAAIPPDTGASTMVYPRPAASSSIERALATSMVEQSMSKALAGAIHRCPEPDRLGELEDAVREDAGCVLHTHSRAGVAVSAQKCGVLPISQQSTFVLGSLAYHDYEGVALRDDEKPRLQADLGTANYLMLRNHGLLTVGRTVPDAFLNMYIFENTCRIQIDAQAGGELIQVNPDILKGVAGAMKKVTVGQGSNLAWPALLRKLDKLDPSYRT